MTTYNTGNPLGSQDPKDLFDNAANMDEAVNNPVPGEWIDWFGNRRKNMAAVEQSVPMAFEAAGEAANQAALADAARIQAENAATAAALSIGTYYPTIAVGLAAVANGASFWVEPNLTDGLNNFVLFSRVDATHAQEKFSVISKQAIDARFQMTEEKIFSGVSDLVFAFVDARGDIVLGVDESSGLRLPGMPDDVQSWAAATGDALDVIGRTLSADDAEDAFTFVDKQDNVIARITAAGDLYLVGMEKSVQEEINSKSQETGRVAGIAGSTRVPKDVFVSSVQEMLISRAGSSEPSVPPSFGLLQQKHAIGTGWLEQAKVVDLGVPHLLDTPYRNADQVVHPYLLEFYNSFRGYRYLLCATPYYLQRAREENPVIYGSHDLASFEMLDGFKQPLADPPVVEGSADAWGHNSDNFFTYGPRTGELVCVWRQSKFTQGTAGPSSSVFDSCLGRRTFDGYQWSEPFYIFPETDRPADSLLSPGMLYDPATGLWHWYTCRGGNITRRTAPSMTGPWSAYTTITAPGINCWHMEVRWVGDKQVMLINDRNASNMFLAISSDFVNWQFAATPVLPAAANGVYKSSFVPEFDAAGMLRLRIVWSARPEQGGQLYVTATPWFNPN